MRNLSLTLLLAAALVGCSAPPPPQAAIDAAEYGEPPITFRSEVRDALSRKLYDPPTAQLRFEEPFRAVVESGAFRDGSTTGGGGGWTAGWVVPVAVKARGAGGAYSPFLPRRFFFPAGGGCFELHDRQGVIAAGEPTR